MSDLKQKGSITELSREFEQADKQLKKVQASNIRIERDLE